MRIKGAVGDRPLNTPQQAAHSDCYWDETLGKYSALVCQTVNCFGTPFKLQYTGNLQEVGLKSSCLLQLGGCQVYKFKQ